jgi:putative DNA primase/helicase
MNKLPKKDAFTTGDKRRDVIISFNNHISDTKDEIKGLSEIIRDADELPGVLNWAIEGLKRLERNQKFSDKRTVAQKGLEYDMKSNPMKYFVDDCIETDPKGGCVPNALLYQAYNTYRLKHGLPEISEQELKNGLKFWCGQIGIQTTEKRERLDKLLGFELDAEFKKSLGKQVRVFTGIKLIQEIEDPKESLAPFTSDVKPTTDLSTDDAFDSAFNS